MPDSPRGRRALSLGGVRLTRRGLTFVASSVVAFIVAYSSGRQEIVYIATLLAVLPAVAVVVVLVKRPRLVASRVFTPHVIPAGSTTSVRVTMRNLAPSRSLRSRWHDELPWYPGHTPEADLPPLQPRSPRFAGRGNSATVGYDLRPPRRGVFSIGPLHVTVGDAFGLATCEHTTGDPQQLIVTPEVFPLAETSISIPGGDGEARLVQRRAAGDDDDTITREYRSGDAMRRVHWRASARHGDLMVRQEEQRSFPQARVIVDTRFEGYRDVFEGDDDDAESEAFEWVVRMLASATVHLRRLGFHVTIHETGLPQLDAGSTTRRRTWGDEELLAELATISLVDTPQTNHSRPDPRTQGPVIAMMGGSDTETLDWLASQRRPGELAVAFLVQNSSAVDRINREFGIAPVASLAAELLVDDGWLVVPVRADDDHAAAWDAVVIEMGRSRGHA